MSEEPLLSVEDLTKHFPVTRGLLGRHAGTVRAVDGVSFELNRGETLGLVGESGCGKTTAGRALLRLIEPTAGSIRFEGHDLRALSAAELRARRHEMQIIFQDPFSSLNPRMRVRDIVGEALVAHRLCTRRELDGRVAELLEKVGVSRALANRYPHEFSGGQRQRIGIARALALRPKFIVCDEAVSALDVSIRAQVINLLLALQRELELSYLFISHDLSVVKHISDRIAVMYLGQIVELGDADDLFERPAHPYTRSLLSAIPLPDPKRRLERVMLRGDVPTPLNPPSGCRFHTRCPAVFERCPKEEPPLLVLGGSHRTRCHHADGLEARSDWFEVLDRNIREQERANEHTRHELEIATEAPAQAAKPPAADVVAAPPAPPRTVPPSDDTPLLSEQAWQVLLAAGFVCFLAGHWLLGGLVVLGSYAWGVRPRLEGVRAADVGIGVGLVVAFWIAITLEEQGRRARAKNEVRELAEEVEACARSTGQYPESLAALGWRLLEALPDGVPVDPWGRSYHYQPPKSPGASGSVSSSGKDEASASDDLFVPLGKPAPGT